MARHPWQYHPRGDPARGDMGRLEGLSEPRYGQALYALAVEQWEDLSGSEREEIQDWYRLRGPRTPLPGLSTRYPERRTDMKPKPDDLEMRSPRTSERPGHELMEDLRVLLECHRAVGQLETARGTLSQTDSQLTQAAGEAIGALPYVEQIAAELRTEFEAKLAGVGE